MLSSFEESITLWAIYLTLLCGGPDPRFTLCISLIGWSMTSSLIDAGGLFLISLYYRQAVTLDVFVFVLKMEEKAMYEFIKLGTGRAITGKNGCNWRTGWVFCFCYFSVSSRNRLHSVLFENSMSILNYL